MMQSFFMTLPNILKQNHQQTLLTDCTLNTNREKHIVVLHVSLFKKFFITKFQNFLFCIMKNKATPFQEISQKDYIVWIIFTKDKVEMPDTQIKSAYCQCTAGLMALWNHFGGMLFRIEAAILLGLTHPSYKSILAKWKIPKLKTKLKLYNWSNQFLLNLIKTKRLHMMKKNPAEPKMIFLLFHVWKPKLIWKG